MHAFTVSNDMFLSDAQTMRLWKGPRVEDERRLSVIEKFLRGNVCTAYASVQIRKVCESQLKVVVKSNGGSKMMNALVGAHSGTTPPSPEVNVSNRYLVNVAGVGSTYCMNKGAEHTSNSVYFIITASYCYQRCFSRKAEIRSGGTTCAEYKSGGVSVPLSVSSVLFPGEAVNSSPAKSLTVSPSPAGLATASQTAPSAVVSGDKNSKSGKTKKRRRMEWGTKKL
ncbi:unnamed protein product [Ectocarpus sp. 12 AP-2014]